MMDYSQVFKKSWKILWQWKSLWIFGVLLALTTVGGFFFIFDGGDNNPVVVENTITLPQGNRVYFPGSGLAIDLTQPGNPLVWIDGERLQNFDDLFANTPEEFIQDAWVILGVLGIVLLFSIALGKVFRFTSEAALIKMVDEGEKRGSSLSVREGFKAGFSRLGWRLFLIDLAIYVPVTLVMMVIFTLALSPLFLWATGSSIAGAIGTVSTLSLLALFGLLAFVVNLLLSPLMPLFRRACIVEGIGVWASIKRGFSMLWTHFTEVLVIWLAWIGIRLAYTLALIPLALLLLPVWLVSLTLGALIAAIPGMLAAGIASLFVPAIPALIIAVIVGLPVFLLFLVLPFACVGGLVEVYKSTLWTLTYKSLCAAELEVRESTLDVRDASLKTTGAA